MATMTDIVDLQEAFTKSGAELFKELYRVYPVADAEDYYKNGQWKNDAMKTDLTLMESHRRESGAPDVPDLEDIKVPNLPSATSQWSTISAGVGVVTGMVKPAGLMPAAPVPMGLNAGTSAPVVEIRLIALFVAKWKLDPVTAKTALAKLTSPHRRYVIQNFKATPLTTGIEACKELEKFIAKCEEEKTWDAATVGAAVPNGPNGVVVAKPATVDGTANITAAKAGIMPRPVGAVVGVAPNPAVGGLKRPLTPVSALPAWAQNKMVRPPVWGGKGFGK